MKTTNLFKLVMSILICESAGVIGSVFTMPALSSWYYLLEKPALNPPSWVFGPVWIVLYFLMGISFFLIWKKNIGGKVQDVMGIFILQLIINTTWSVVFFGLESPRFAFIILIAMWFAIIWTILAFRKISRPAAWLLLPYLLWVTFAGYLNCAIWYLN